MPDFNCIGKNRPWNKLMMMVVLAGRESRSTERNEGRAVKDQNLLGEV